MRRRVYFWSLRVNSRQNFHEPALRRRRSEMAPPTFIYSVKFICGIQDPPLSSNPNKCLTVQPGYYSTEINIHNFHPGPSTGHPATINKQLLLLIDNGVEKGKETISP